MIIEQLLSERYRFKEDFIPGWLTQTQLEARRLFLDEIHKKSRYKNVRECPYCGSDSFIKISEVNRRGLPSDIVICSSCDGCFKSTILDSEANRYYYENISPLFRDRDPSCSTIDSNFERRVESFAYPRYHFVSHFIKFDPDKDLIVELGCDDGANLIPWKKMGYRIFGIDMNSRMVEFGRKKGLNLVCGDFLDYDFSGMVPRLIILSHVLGHVMDVNATLKKIHDILAHNGYVFIETPGIRSWNLVDVFKFFDVECNYYFDINSISKVLKKNLFKINYADEYMRILCTPNQGQPNFKNTFVPLSLDMVKTHLLGVIINSMNFYNKKLYDLLSEGEKCSIKVRIFNKLQRLYFRSFYNSLTKTDE